MKVGPVHLIRDDTFRRLHAMQDLWHRFSAELTAARADGNVSAYRESRGPRSSGRLDTATSTTRRTSSGVGWVSRLRRRYTTTSGSG